MKEKALWSIYALVPLLAAALTAAGRKEQTEHGGAAGLSEKAAAFIYRVLRRRGPFPGEKEVYRPRVFWRLPWGPGKGPETGI